MYLQHCQDKAAATAFAGLWLPPLLTPIVAALVLAVGFCWRAKTTSRGRQRPWLLRGVFLAFLVTFVWTSTSSMEVFLCSDRDTCDPMRCVPSAARWASRFLPARPYQDGWCCCFHGFASGSRSPAPLPTPR